MRNKEPNRNVYVGHRYVPKVFGEWNKKNEYEGLSVVLYKGNSYTSKKRVPVGIDILNEEFWVVTGNYNAQVEYYRDEVRTLEDNLKTFKTKTNTDISKLDNNIENNKRYANDRFNNVEQDISEYKRENTLQFNNIKNDIKEVENKHSTDITSVNNSIKNKIDKGNVTVKDIDINKGKITQAQLSDDVLQAMAGDSDVHMIPEDGSITNVKLSDKIIHSRNIGDNQVLNSHLATGSVDERNIGDKQVKQKHLDFNSKTLNHGKLFPLINYAVNGAMEEYNSNISKYILSVKIDNAETDRVYQIGSIRNGYYDNYGVVVYSYKTPPENNSIYTSSKTKVIDVKDLKDTFTNDDGFITMIAEGRNGEVITVTFEDSFSFLNLSEVLGGSTTPSLGLIIDPSLYNFKGQKSFNKDSYKTIVHKRESDFYIYQLKSNGNYLGIEVQSYVKGLENTASSNYDLYQVRTIKEYVRSGEIFTPVRSFIDDSKPTTMDLMIRESNDMDYMGGINHGDELNTFTMLLIDGKEIEMSETGFYYADEVRLIQKNNLYRDTVYTEGELQNVAKVGKEHIFNKDGYTLHNTVKWLESINIVQAFLGSLTLYREDNHGYSPLWHSVIDDINYDKFDIRSVSGQSPSTENVEQVIINGDKVSCVMKVNRMKNIPGNQTWTANFSNVNSKVYFSYVPNGYTTSAGEVWKQDTNYQFNLE